MILHERMTFEVEQADFADLRVRPGKRRVAFMEWLERHYIREVPIHIISSVIDKNRLSQKYAIPDNPYEIALRFCMERLLTRLLNHNQAGKFIHIIFESRGRREDEDLELEFRRICANRDNWGHGSMNFTQMRFEPVFVSKRANSVGLQLADLVARPIALSVMRPNQSNRAYDIIRPKMWDLEKFP